MRPVRTQSIKQRNWTPPTRLRSFEKAAPIAKVRGAITMLAV